VSICQNNRYIESLPTLILPESATSVNDANTAEQQANVDRLKSRLDALEYENERLRSALDESKVADSGVSDFNETQAEKDQVLMARVLDLETRLQAAESSFDERDSMIDSLQNTLAGVERLKEEGEQRLADLEVKLAESTAFAESLSQTVELKEAEEKELESILNAKNAEVVALEGHVDKLNARLEDEKDELGGQINELRQAGQVRCLQNIHPLLILADLPIRKLLLFTRNV
jgi:CAP-Gly domain-containing linker protein 1